MLDFDYYIPTKIYFGKGKENEVGRIVSEYGFKKVLIHYGGGSVSQSGLLNRVTKSLEENNIEYVLLGGVLPNPDISLVKEGVSLARENKVDMILALGGGSVIDSSKSISHGFYYDGDPFDFNLKKAEPNLHLPVGVILTIAAAGSEMSTSCVISSRELEIKKGFNTELNRPLFAIENPELTYSVSKYQTACGITDIISHTFERYFSTSNEFEFSDYLAEGLMKSVMEAGLEAIENPTSYEARSALMLASSYSHNGLTSLGKKANMPIHQLEHELSARNPSIAHGAGLAVLTPAWMECVYQYDKEKFIKFAKNVMLINDECDEELLIIKAIDKMKEFYESIGMPATLTELGIVEEDIEIMANRLSKDGTFIYPSHVPIDRNLMIDIYRKCL